MNSSTIAFRVKPEIKRRADALFSRLGMTTSTAMNILLMYTLEHRGFPHGITLPDTHTEEDEANEYPNTETRAILDRDMAGLEPSHGPFNSVDEMFDDLMKN